MSIALFISDFLIDHCVLCEVHVVMFQVQLQRYNFLGYLGLKCEFTSNFPGERFPLCF